MMDKKWKMARGPPSILIKGMKSIMTLHTSKKRSILSLKWMLE